MKAISKMVLVAIGVSLLAGCGGGMFKSVDQKLNEAIGAGDYDTANRLIANGADVNSQELLHTSAFLGHLPSAAYLIEKGANVYLRNDDGQTPLDVAEENCEGFFTPICNPEMVEFLKKSPGDQRIAATSILREQGINTQVRQVAQTESGNWLSKAARLGVGAVGLAAGGEVLKAGDEQLAQDIAAVSVQIAAGKELEDIKTFSELASSTSSTVASVGGAGGLCERESNKANRQTARHEAEREQPGIKPKHCASLKIFILAMRFNKQCAQDPSLTPAQRQQSEAQYKVAREKAKQVYDGVNQMVANGTIQTDCDLEDVAWTGMARNL